MLNPQMKSWGLYELYHQRAEAAAEPAQLSCCLIFSTS